jgi:histone H3/H4
MAKKTASAAKPAAAAKPKPAVDRGSFIAKAPIRRLMKQEGAGLVAEGAVDLLIESLTKIAKNVTQAAVKLVKEEGRKRVTAGDILAAERL